MTTAMLCESYKSEVVVVSCFEIFTKVATMMSDIPNGFFNGLFTCFLYLLVFPHVHHGFMQRRVGAKI